jgi:hypothetical protein
MFQQIVLIQALSRYISLLYIHDGTKICDAE